MSPKLTPEPVSAPRVTLSSNVLRKIRRHARSSPRTEVCGVLVGTASDDGVVVEACIPGRNAAQAGTHVTFTQDTWEHIYRVKDSDYPDLRLVGWYHSHPGFGVFLSDHDTFIHQNFFSAPTQIAWVYDPHADTEGCFGYVGGEITRLRDLNVRDDGTDLPCDDTEFDGSGDHDAPPLTAEGSPSRRWSDPLLTLLSYVAAMMLGALLALYLAPRAIVVRMPQDFNDSIRAAPRDPGKPALPAPPAPERRAGDRGPGGGGK